MEKLIKIEHSKSRNQKDKEKKQNKTKHHIQFQNIYENLLIDTYFVILFCPMDKAFLVQKIIWEFSGNSEHDSKA